jgi:signal transduction histidine kinase
VANKPEKRHLRLKEAIHASEHGKLISNQLLTFAKGNNPVIKTIELTEIIKETVTSTLRGSSVVADFNLARDLWPVDADRVQIGQVIVNLVNNARQAMPNGGVIKINTRNITRGVKGGVEGKFLLVQFEDKGCGIPTEYLDRIFDPFSPTRENGRGLGLPVANSIVQKHGGFIDIESVEGGGTFFFVYLPASEKALAQLDTSSGIPPNPRLVLVMDEEEIIRSVLVGGLKQAGYVANSATNGSETIELYMKASVLENPMTLSSWAYNYMRAWGV